MTIKNSTHEYVVCCSGTSRYLKREYAAVCVCMVDWSDYYSYHMVDSLVQLVALRQHDSQGWWFDSCAGNISYYDAVKI